MQRRIILLAVTTALFSCTSQSSKNKFEISGTLTNNTAKVIYLEQIPVATMQRMVVDSFVLGKDGKYVLKADQGEACVYNLRLDQNTYPLAAVVNDVPKITVDAKFSKENNQFVESYEVKGSEASQQMKDFMFAFNNKLQTVFYNDHIMDSLKKAGASDSLVASVQQENMNTAISIKNLSTDFINKSSNPALTMFELGYYQTTANNSGSQLEGMNNDEVTGIINRLAAKFPQHQGVIAVKKSLDAQVQKTEGLVGRPAPEIDLPDANGREVKLSSFKGKYVLVDFWASWCGPCRAENPNVVKVYNKYKDKNFAILGVSLDRPDGKADWIKAIMHDNLTWTQVSELKEWESQVVTDYNFGQIGIPFNALVDPEGKIIAEGLRGEALEAKLATIFK